MISMDFYLQQMLNALQVGSVYALIALGYTMVYGVLSMINFAHGDIFMIGSYIAFFSATWLIGRDYSAPGVVLFIAATLLAMLGAALLAVLIERIAYRPLRKAPRISMVITALGVGLMLENVSVAVPWIGPQARSLPSLLPTSTFRLSGVSVSALPVIIFGVSMVTMLLLDTLVQRTRTGIAMRAVSWDCDTARLMGVPVDRIISLTFAIGAATAAVGGALYGTAYTIDPYIGIRVGWWAFIAAVVGGIGNMRGAVLGGYVLGFVEIFTPLVLPASTYRDLVAFSLLLVLLVFRPAGLLGRAVNQKV